MYQARMQYKGKFSTVWVTGLTNHKSSNITDHGNSEQHIACMVHIRTNGAKARTNLSNPTRPSYISCCVWRIAKRK